MTKVEVKKEIYKQDPDATLIGADKNGVRYTATFNQDADWMAVFVIPHEPKEYGETFFTTTMKAKHLLRWLDTFEQMPV